MILCAAGVEENHHEWSQFSEVQEISIFSCLPLDGVCVTSAPLLLKTEFLSGAFGLIPNFLIKKEMLKSISHF